MKKQKVTSTAIQTEQFFILYLLMLATPLNLDQEAN